MKIKCEFDGELTECRVIENMGYQGGNYVMAVEYEGEEKIVIKVGKAWRPKTVLEKLEPGSNYVGQRN